MDPTDTTLTDEEISTVLPGQSPAATISADTDTNDQSGAERQDADDTDTTDQKVDQSHQDTTDQTDTADGTDA